MSCGVGGRCSLDPVLLWLWCRPVAAAPSGLLAWEPPNVAGVALKKKKGQKTKNKQQKKSRWDTFFSFFFLFGHTCNIWTFQGQGSNPSHSRDLSYCSDNARPLTHCSTRELLNTFFYFTSADLTTSKYLFSQRLLCGKKG